MPQPRKWTLKTAFSGANWIFSQKFLLGCPHACSHLIGFRIRFWFSYMYLCWFENNSPKNDGLTWKLYEKHNRIRCETRCWPTCSCGIHARYSLISEGEGAWGWILQHFPRTPNKSMTTIGRRHCVWYSANDFNARVSLTNRTPLFN